jgi:glycosyltransferase involved in cell wall biosynthesis
MPRTKENNMSQPKVSIVVPIYGVEKYLNQCVDSILAQTLKDIEIILVDDGSKDRCPQIVDEYAKKDQRIVAIHQPNGGYGRAVNHGIEVAKGEYIGIIESDDWIEPTMYEKMYQSAKENDTDITKCEFYHYNSLLPKDEQNVKWKCDPYQNLDNAPEGCFSIDQYPLLLSFHASIWANIYKADFIKVQKVIESRSASYQDFPFMIEVMCRAKRISVVKEPLVHYRMENGQDSSTVRRDERLILMPIQCSEGKKILKKYQKYEQLKEEFYFHSYLACIGFYYNIYLKFKKKYFNEFHRLMKDIATDNTFTYKYFSTMQKQECKQIAQGNFFNSFITKRHLRAIRRFLISIRINRHDFCLQLLGLQFATSKYRSRIALIKFSPWA